MAKLRKKEKSEVQETLEDVQKTLSESPEEAIEAHNEFTEESFEALPVDSDYSQHPKFHKFKKGE